LSRIKQSCSVIVVDDEDAVGALLELVLEGWGYTVRAASSVGAARVLFESSPPDIIITDLEMPEADGFEFLRFIEAVEPRVPVIAVTGTADARVLDRAHASGFCEVLAKPYDSARLYCAIKRALPQPLMAT
jgi:CheY-like chemotaxis protein